MIERFVEESKGTVQFARDEAAKCGSPEITPEHILLGLLRDGLSLANGALNSVSPRSLRAEILASLPQHDQQSYPSDIPLSPDSQRVLAAAELAADLLAHRQVMDYHILLGLVHIGGSSAAELLRRNGISDDFPKEQMQPFSSANLSPPERRLFDVEAQAIALAQGEDYAGALKLLNDAIEDPSLDRNQTVRKLAPLASATAMRIGNLDLEKRYYELEIATDPNNALAHYGLAYCHKKQGKIDEAKRIARRTYQLSVAKGGAIGEGLAEMIERQFPEAKSEP
jgi:ATP-dependent Clp protease ATP-binding subunit ClpA